MQAAPSEHAPSGKGRWLTPAEALARQPGGHAAEAPQSVEQPLRYGFRAGSVGLLIAAERSGEVLEDTTVFPIPNTAEWLRGLINVRGNLVPVFDLETLFESSSESTRPERLLLIGAGADAVAFPIVRLPEALRVDTPLPQRPAVYRPLDPHVKAAFLIDETLWLEVDLDAFLLSLSDGA